MFAVLISGDTVVDGSGAPGFAADVGINGENIISIGDFSDIKAGAGRVIDATGLTVSPGFIDTYAHPDGALLLDPQHANGLARAPPPRCWVRTASPTRRCRIRTT